MSEQADEVGVQIEIGATAEVIPADQAEQGEAAGEDEE